MLIAVCDRCQGSDSCETVAGSGQNELTLLIAVCDRCQGSDSSTPSCTDFLIICEPRGRGVHMVNPHATGCTGELVSMISNGMQVCVSIRFKRTVVRRMHKAGL